MRRIVPRARRGALASLDEITLAPRGDGVRVTYDARLTLAGVARAFDPLLNAWFQRSGARSPEGLRRAYSAPAAAAEPRRERRPQRARRERAESLR